MPNWKKLVISGSNAALSSLFVSNAVTASIVSASTVIGTTGNFNNLQVTGSTVMSGSGVLLQLIGSGSTIFSISGSGGEIFKIADDANNTSLFTVSSASINVLDIDSSKNVRISGSLIVTGSITGSLFGTASWAQSASIALTSSYVNLLAGPNITINYQTNGIAITGSGGGTPGGSNTQIQFNSASVFSGSSNLTFDYVNNQVQLSGSLIVSNSLDTNTRVLYNDLLKTTLDWDNSKLYSNNTSQSIAWDERKLFDINGVDALEYTNTTTSNGVRLFGTASFALTASYVTGSIFTDTNPALSASYAVTASFVPTIKSGVVSTFVGNPKTGSVTFGTAYANASYAVTVTGGTGVARSWTIDSKTTTGFIINSNSNTAISGEVNWIAVPYNS